jgi:PAS domain S-box-containing protein
MNYVLTRMVQSINLYQMIAENTTDLVCVHDSLNTIRYATPSSKSILGYMPEALLGKRLTDFLSEDFLNEMDFSTLKRFFDNPGARIRYQVRHADMRLRWLETTFTSMSHQPDMEYTILSSTRDITESVHLTEDLMEALSKEQELSRFKSNLYSVASHEFKTPLAVIQANIEMLKVKNSEKLLKMSLMSMEEEIDRVNDMIADMLQLKKLTSGETPFFPDNLDLGNLIKEIIENDVKKAYPKVNITLKPATLPAYPYVGDYSLLRYVFGNLLSNACKFSVNKQEVLIQFHATDSAIEISVSDKGIGIPEQDQRTIFNSFYRASNVGNIGGTGVGLSVVKEFVHLHKGTISFVSKADEGSTFTVTLPTTNKSQTA